MRPVKLFEICLMTMALTGGGAPALATEGATKAATATATQVSASGAASSSSGSSLTLEQVRGLQSNIKKAEHLSVDFVQTRFTALRGKSIRRDGKARFSRPNLFRWTLENPTKELIFDGKVFYEYDPASKSAVKYAPSGANARELTQIVDLVLNFDSLLKRYDLVRATDEGDLVKIELKPKKDQEIIGVELRYDKKADFVAYVRLDLANKNKLTHEFASPKRTPIASDAYALPAGVKVTDTN
jgi:chaperone LolA